MLLNLKSSRMFALLSSAVVSSAIAQSPLLDLRFEASMNGRDGELPTQQPLGTSFSRGYAELGASFAADSDLRYGAEGNILATEGTLEFWVRPTWNGNDGQTHVFLNYGLGGGGMIFMKDGAGNLRSIFNQYGPNGIPEMGVSFNVNSWAANRWRHVAYTWSSADHELRIYVDGTLRNTTSLTAYLPLVHDSNFTVGSSWASNQSLSTLDELRIYAAPRTGAEIAADYASDVASHPSLTLSFENTAVGDDGEGPSAQFNVAYGAGVTGQCAIFGPASNLQYAAGNNIAAKEGTLEFWVKPLWNGNDGQSHAFLGWGGAGGMLFAKDGANNLRAIFNRFGPGGIPEMGLGLGVNDWVANQWYHVAYTWSNAQHRAVLYINGRPEAETSLSHDLPAIADSSFIVGHEINGAQISASLDELRIYPFARTDSQVMADVVADIRVLSIEITPETDTLFPTWRSWPTVIGQTVIGPVVILPDALQWESSNPAAVAIESVSVPRAIAPGEATITATFGPHSDTMQISVLAPVRAVDEPATQPYLTEPVVGAVYELPVLSIRYIPTQDGENVDEALTGYSGTVQGVIDWIDNIEVETKFMLEEGSRFRGYANSGARPSIGYRVVRTLNVYEPLPPDRNTDHATGSEGVYFPDYAAILNRFDIQDLIQNLGVREVWLWGYHHGAIVPVESNMSSPLTGDISNSYRFPDDLPIFDSTYVLYNYNWTRSSNESVHDHGHQIEAALSYVNNLQDNNTDLFWHNFVGQDGNGEFITGRCGWTHMPPNTTSHYDYENPAVVPSDIFGWTPAGGLTQDVNADTWGSLQYQWPSGQAPEGLTEHNWYVFWMQSLPGLDSTIPYDLGNGSITNWWSFIADWDRAIPDVSPNFGLYSGQPALTFTSHPQSGNVCIGATVTLSALAEGAPAAGVSYRWKASGEWIGNGPTGNGSEISGAFTNELTISNIQPADAVTFECVAANAIASVTSEPATLSYCPPDYDCDGFITGIDFDLFVADFEAGVMSSDFDRDGFITGLDFDLFVQAYEAGC